MKPLVPDDSDLRSMPWMILDAAQLLNSDFFVFATGNEFSAEKMGDGSCVNTAR